MHPLPDGTMFMGGWIMDSQVCDGIVRVFETAPPDQLLRGKTGRAGGAVIDLSVKDSTEMAFVPQDPRPEWKAYRSALSTVVDSYLQVRVAGRCKGLRV